MNITRARKIVAKKHNLGRSVWLLKDKQIWAMYFKKEL